MDPEIAHQAVEIAREPHRDRRPRDAVFEHDQPAHHPGEHLPQRGIGIGVGRSRNGHGRGEFGITKRREGTKLSASRCECWSQVLSKELRINCLMPRSEEHTSELQSLMRISYAVFCLKKKKHNKY